MDTTSPTPRDPIEVRDLRFDLSQVPTHWHGGRRAVSLFFDNLSVFFPPGERFFVASVKAFADRVQHDPALAREVKAFCAQEGHHSREHVRYNEMLARQGLPVEVMEERVARLLRRTSRVRTKRQQLAATCALEHFTSLLGTLVLRDPRTLEGAHPTMAALWRWHAAEENEHKDVAFDVHQAAGGPWHERAHVMALTTVVFWAKVLEQQARLMHADGILLSPAEWLALARFLFVEPGGLLGLVGPYLRYYRPGFHPRELDTSALVARWKDLFAPAPG